MKWLALISALLLPQLALADGEVLAGTFRAVTLNPGERKLFSAKGLERVTGSSGRCVEEGMQSDTFDTLYLEATCDGVRILMAWVQGAERFHILACAESEERSKESVKLREKVQKELKAMKTVTACVRAKQVVLLGWAMSPDEKAKVVAVQKKFAGDGVVDRVELVTDEAKR